MGSPVVHWEIVSRDGAGLQRFYADLFDWKIDSANPMGYGLVDTGNERGINGGIGSSDQHAGVTVYVEVDDLQVHLDRAEQLGGKAIMPPTEIPGAITLAVFADPDGNRLGIVKGR